MLKNIFFNFLHITVCVEVHQIYPSIQRLLIGLNYVMKKGWWFWTGEVAAWWRHRCGN